VYKRPRFCKGQGEEEKTCLKKNTYSWGGDSGEEGTKIKWRGGKNWPGEGKLISGNTTDNDGARKGKGLSHMPGKDISVAGRPKRGRGKKKKAQ